MIGKLKGLVDELHEEHLLLDVGGVCYELMCSRVTLSALPAIGQAVSIWTELHIREDAHTLYGFASTEEREWFRLLTTVQGVGAKAALAILSVLRPAELATAIAAQDKTAVQRANGVGPKLAMRVVSELKDKAGKLATAPIGLSAARSGTSPLSGGSSGKASSPLLQPADTLVQDATSALTHLGYSASDAFAAIARIRQAQPDVTDLQQLIPLALRELSPLRA